MRVTGVGVSLLVLGAMTDGARGQCTQPYTQWPSPFLTGGGAASAPIADTSFAGGKSYSYVVQGTALYKVCNVDDGSGTCGAGVKKWQWDEPNVTSIQNFPSPVPLSKTGAGSFIFVGALDGFVYKINATDKVTGNLSAPTRRSSCDVGQSDPDGILATPTVQLYAFSDCTFREAIDPCPSSCAPDPKGCHVGNGAHAQDDLVFVITRTGCNDTASNRVIAFYAKDLSVRWTYNAKPFDFASDGCSVDYQRNQIYCGVNKQSGQISLFALNTATASASGNLKWAGSPGSIRNTPLIANNKVYVVTNAGLVWAYDPAGNAGNAKPVWPNGYQLPSTVTQNIWFEFRPGPFQGRLITGYGSGGTLAAISDNGAAAGPTLAWERPPPSGQTFTSMPIVLPSVLVGPATEAKAFVGLSNGRLWQIDLVGGDAQGEATIGSSTTYDAAFDIEAPSTDINRITVATGSGQMQRLCVPLSNTPPGGGVLGCTINDHCNRPTAPGAPGTFCHPWVCVGSGAKHCVPAGPRADFTPCDDTKACTCHSSIPGETPGCTVPGPSCATSNGLPPAVNWGMTNCNDVCLGGVCQSDFYGSCSCASQGDRACSNSTCCTGGCKDLLIDNNNCGSCGEVCLAPKSCSDGNCN